METVEQDATPSKKHKNNALCCLAAVIFVFIHRNLLLLIGVILAEKGKEKYSYFDIQKLIVQINLIF